jgi:glycosyltransferase involved in cell wall biosynthesis
MVARQMPHLMLYTAHLSATGGGQHAKSRLAVALRARDYAVTVVAEPPFSESHRYVSWLRAAGIPIEILPSQEEGAAFRSLRLAVQALGTLPYAILRRRRLADATSALGEICRTVQTSLRGRRIATRLTSLLGRHPTILHVWGPSALTPLLLGWAKRREIPAIYHEMGEADEKYVHDWGLERTVESINGSACVVCCSPSVAANIRQIYAYDGLIHTIPFMIEDPPDTLQPRESSQRVVFGAIGRLVPHKHHAGLIHAIGTLRAEGSDVGLLIAGDGPTRPDLERLAADLGLADHVTFTGEFESLESVMARFDVFALVSSSESQCMPITESMAYGKPVIATRFGGIPDFVEEGVTGTLVEIGDQSALVEAMRALVVDGDLRRRMGSAGKAAYLARYSETRIVHLIEEAYAPLIAEETGSDVRHRW